MAETSREKKERIRAALNLERSSFMSHWKDISNVFAPRRGRFLVTDRNKGDKRYNNIINNKGVMAVRVFTAGMLAGTMSPSRPWFVLETDDEDLMEFQPVKLYFERYGKLIQTILADSNFYEMAATLIRENGLFATAAMSHVDDFNDVARFRTHTVGSYAIATDSRGDVVYMTREYQETASQLVERFGLKNCSIAVQTAYERGNYNNWFDVVHFLGPNTSPVYGSKLSKDKKFTSCYYEPGNPNRDQYLEEKGFDEFPMHVVRWDVTDGDAWGTDCPAMTALGDNRALQIQEKRKAQGIDKMVAPPLKGPSSLAKVTVSALPSDLTVYDMTDTGQGLSPIYQVQPQLGELRLDMSAIEGRVDDAFFVKLFLAISEMEGIQPRNQLDIIQRNEERLLQLGPPLQRQYSDLGNRLIDRIYNQCERAGIGPVPPPELRGKVIKIRYVSTLAMAQRAVATGGIERLSGYVIGLVGGGFEEAKFKFDAMQSVDEYAKAIGVSPKLIVPDELANQNYQSFQQQQAAAAGLAAAQSGADTASKLAGAKLDQPSALTAIAGAANG